MALSEYTVEFVAVSLGNAAVFVLSVTGGWREEVFDAITFRDVGGVFEVGLLPSVSVS